MAFKDYTEFIEPLRLPYQGKEYDIPPVGARDGATLIVALDPESDETMTDDEFKRILLGPALDQMLEDNVPAGFIVRATMTALADFQAGREVAEGIWETGADPKAIEAWVSIRAEESEPSTTTAGVKKTRSRASTKATTSPPN